MQGNKVGITFEFLVRMQEKGAELVISELGDGYEILEIFVAHPAGMVYRLKDSSADKIFLLRIFSAKPPRASKAYENFDILSRDFAAVNHPKVQPMLSAGFFSNGLPYVLTHNVEGEPLSSILQTNERLSPTSAIDIALGVCGALKYVHELGIVHGNLAPSNIVARRYKDRFQLMSIIGFEIEPFISDSDGYSPSFSRDCLYMSPEQCDIRTVDRRSDIYSLGCIMYQMLTGRPPHSAPQASVVLLKHTRDDPALFNEVWSEGRFPLGLQEIVLRCLEKNPQDRYQTLSALEADLSSVRAADKVLPVWMSKHAMVVTACTLLCASLIMSGIAIAMNTAFESISSQICFSIPKYGSKKSIYRSTTARTLRDAVKEAADRKVSLAGANLEEANLSGMDLRGLDLKGAHISGLLIKTNLEGADLSGASLERCKAMYANLHGAKLNDAKLKSCNLASADLRGTEVSGTAFGAVNMTGTKTAGTEFNIDQKKGFFYTQRIGIKDIK